MIDIYHKLINRVRMMFGRGRVSWVDDSTSTQKIQVIFGPLEINDCYRLAEFGFVSNPPEGADVCAAFLGADRSNGIVLGTGHQAYRMKELQPGESAIHDALGKYVYLTESGIVVEAKGQPVTINNATIVTINSSTEIVMNTPTLQVNGNIQATGDILDQSGTNTSSMSSMRATFDGHDHPDPQGGNTGITNQRM